MTTLNNTVSDERKARTRNLFEVATNRINDETGATVALSSWEVDGEEEHAINGADASGDEVYIPHLTSNYDIDSAVLGIKKHEKTRAWFASRRKA